MSTDLAFDVSAHHPPVPAPRSPSTRRGGGAGAGAGAAAAALTKPPDAAHVSGLIKTLLGMRATLAAVPNMGELLDNSEAPLLVGAGTSGCICLPCSGSLLGP